MPRALVVSADGELSGWLATRLQRHGWHAAVVGSAAEANALPGEAERALVLFDAVLLDGGADPGAEELLRASSEGGILLVAVPPGSAALAARLIEQGVHDVLPHPTHAAATDSDARLAERRLELAITAAQARLVESRLRLLESSFGVQRAFFEGLFESAPEGIVVGDPDDRVLRANHEFCRIFGYSPEEVVGRGIDELIASGPIQEEAAAVTLQVRGGETVAIDTVRCRCDGTPVHVSLLARPIHIGAGKVGTFGIYRDITAQREAQRALDRREQEFRALVENAPDVISRIDRAFRHVYVNPAIERLTGLPAEHFRGKTNDEIGLPAELAALRRSHAAAVFETGREERFDYEAIVAAGRVSLQTRLVPEFAEDGSVASALEITRDVTAHKAAETALRQSEEFYRYLFERSPQPMWVYDCETLRFLAVNQTALLQYGYSVDEFLRMTLEDIRPPEDVPKLRENLARAPRSGFDRAGIWRHRSRAGEQLWVEIVSHDLIYEGRSARLVLATDVTARIAMEEAVREAGQRYRALFDQLPLGVMHFDHHFRILACNTALAEMVGSSPDELVGFDLTALHDDRVLPAIRQALAGEPSRYEGPYVTTLTARKVWLSAHLSPLHDAQGRVAGGIAVVEDATLRRMAEARLATQARELEAVNVTLQERTAELEAALRSRSRLYASMNHELRTPISAIMLYNELLLAGAMGELNAAQREGVQLAQNSAQHLMELVQDVLDLARLEAGKLTINFAPVAIAKLIREALPAVQPLAAQRGSLVETCLCGDDGSIITDGRRVRQILFNLVSNAAKFGEGKPIHVRCRRTADGGMAIAVQDHGRGIATEDRERIFEEFAQAGEPQATGTGLGLAICRRLAELLGGTLEVTSELGAGSTFSLLLPPRLPGAESTGEDGERPQAPA